MADSGTAAKLDDARLPDHDNLSRPPDVTGARSASRTSTPEAAPCPIVEVSNSGNGGAAKRRGPTRSQQLNKLYALPAPVRTFPLPAFIPHNPLSLLQIVYTWVTQAVFPPNGHPEILYQGWYSPETRSVHVTDQRSIRALWEQGFYGKGSLSRSEPSWLDREKRRRGATASQTSEEVTRKRREERQQIKWERARKEREAIDQKLQEERTLAEAVTPAVCPKGKQQTKSFLSPVGPLELLSLPNSLSDLERLGACEPIKDSTLSDVLREMNGTKLNGQIPESPNVGSQAKLEVPPVPTSDPRTNQSSVCQVEFTHENEGNAINDTIRINGTSLVNGDVHTHLSAEKNTQRKSTKSVRFSPTVEQTTYFQSDPPRPENAVPTPSKGDEEPLAIKDMEHLQLSMEEAFFLSYGFGVLEVRDSQTKKAIPTRDLFSLFRHNSYFSSLPNLRPTPDDRFMVSYIVYHHFRSLGWVVRGGIKFSVDYLLYNRGPVFTHAEFAVMILPSYSDPYWSRDADTRQYVAKKQSRSWSWLHCVNRVNSQVKKTLVLVYVDIPPPLATEVEDGMAIDGILARYKVREMVLKRWISNRSRD
ncbi:MAG: tRNA splicing endonuclease subunit sen2 [Claussenomyces sp. TS43310]|nr:MAG: tRNA splicing endonuclease subunit sen2 [Claussenomyces sp. TS43310]